jgi:ubiquinone/menaquinone biosynthesis C-methylase UbiE
MKWTFGRNRVKVSSPEAMATLLEIYQRRPDLRTAYPEAASGQCAGLLTWARAVTNGQVEDSASVVLTPYRTYYSQAASAEKKAPAPAPAIKAYFRRTGKQEPSPATCRVFDLSLLNESYRQHVRNLIATHQRDQAMSMAIGGNYEQFGIMQREFLIQQGLQPQNYLIDVGCGSGRLAFALRDYLAGNYLGIDVVPELLDYARERCPSRWRFAMAEGLSIPAASDQADIVCFFSVFTHMLHEDSYRYLRDAVRVLKPGGKIIFSYLEFAVISHWNAFQAMLDRKERTYLDIFISNDAIQAWASHLGLTIELLQRGDQRFIPLPSPLILDDGSQQDGFGSTGQSVAVLCKAK